MSDTAPRTRAEINRANAAKSTGPITPAGKARAARNSTRHGLRARQVLLPGESRPKFYDLLRSFQEQFRPQTAIEARLVFEMAASSWRLRRLVAIETHMLVHKLEHHRKYIEEFVQNPDRDKKLAYVFESMSSGSALALLGRYEAALTRAFDKAFKQLQSLQNQQKAGKQNETPILPEIGCSDVALKCRENYDTSDESKEPMTLPSCLRCGQILIALAIGAMLRAQDPGANATRIYQQSAPSVFLLIVRNNVGQDVAQGTGFLIEGGKIVTNEHVVRGGSVVVAIGPVKLPARVERIDSGNDLAILSTEAELTANPLKFRKRCSRTRRERFRYWQSSGIRAIN